MRIYYHLSEYISHRRAGEAYIVCLKSLGHDLVGDPEKSDLIIVHEAPHHYPAILRDMPRPSGCKVVGYGVWETPQLPRLFVDGVRCVDAVWTASAFSCRAFSPHVRTHVLPHVVERPKVSRDDMAWAMARLGITGKHRDARRIFYFYTIVDTVNPRKDIATLLTAFAAAFPLAEDNVRLVVKQYRKPQNLEGLSHLIDIPEDLSDGRIAALHAVCDAYVSTHHAEAWGLPLSEALSFGNPVIATGYSGNMEFMTEENSFPVPYTIEPVTEKMCLALPHLFSQDMTWADIDTAAFMQILRKIRTRPVSTEFRARVAASMKPFSSEAIAGRLHSLLQLL